MHFLHNRYTGSGVLSPKLLLCVSALIPLLTASPAVALVEWSTTELHFQYGHIENPFSDANENTFILTLQNALGWKYGESFFFADFIEDVEGDGFNDTDLYFEWFPSLSLGKLTHKKLGIGPIKDFSLLVGLNVSVDAKVIKYLPGLRASWDIPGFAFLNTDLTAYIDDSRGVSRGGAPKQTDSFMFNLNWAYPFSIGNLDFSIEGYAEYVHSRTDEFGNHVKSWFLTQPQFRLDLGKLLNGGADRLFIGMEYQYWWNKLGTKNDESLPQFLLAWRF